MRNIILLILVCLMIPNSFATIERNIPELSVIETLWGVIFSPITEPIMEFYNLTQDKRKEVTCLADNIYFESSGETEAGKVAVGLVTMNRVNSGMFPSTVCGVVKQKVKSTCQFSWWCSETKRKTSLNKEKYFSSKETEIYNDIRNTAMDIYMNYKIIKDNTYGSLYFHANYIDPKWGKNLKKTVSIGNHKFYSTRD